MGRTNPSLSSIHQMKGQENDSSLSDDEMSVALLLDRLMEAAAVHTNEVCHFTMEGLSDWTTGRVTPVLGKTVNPSLARVRHSCCPNTAKVCRDNNTLLIAQNNIRAGDPVTINYTLPFYASPLRDRQQFLESCYRLTCQVQTGPVLENKHLERNVPMLTILAALATC